MSGKGRGRGWLKLDKVQEAKPGSISPATPAPPTPEIKFNDEWMEKFQLIENEIRKMNADDDGIKLNKKYKIIITMLKDELTTSESVRGLSQYVFNKALQDESFITPFIVFITLQTFGNLFICEERPRTLIITCMQQKFELHDATALKEDKTTFHNSVKLLSEFYNRTNYSFISQVILENFILLLDSGEAENVELFTNMYLKNCTRLIDVTLFLKLRDVMISKNTLPESTKVKLMLIIDMSSDKIGKLSPELVTYYKNKLGETNLPLPQSSYPISIETSSPSKFEKYISDVNVLLCVNKKQNEAPSDDCSSTNNWISPPPYNSPPVSLAENNHDVKYNRAMDAANFRKTEYNILPPDDIKQDGYSRAGRPILGAGARDKNIIKGDSGMSNLGRSASQTNNSYNRSYKNKGWQHDDRFENDYS